MATTKVLSSLVPAPAGLYVLIEVRTFDRQTKKLDVVQSNKLPVYAFVVVREDYEDEESEYEVEPVLHTPDGRLANVTEYCRDLHFDFEDVPNVFVHSELLPREGE